jgi:hypothetical protein
MTSFKTLLEFLDELAAITVEHRREESTMAVAIVATRNGRRILFVERTYRPGVCFILYPAPEELREAREGDLWKLWNSERAVSLGGIV